MLENWYCLADNSERFRLPLLRLFFEGKNRDKIFRFRDFVFFCLLSVFASSLLFTFWSKFRDFCQIFGFFPRTDFPLWASQKTKTGFCFRDLCFCPRFFSPLRGAVFLVDSGFFPLLVLNVPTDCVTRWPDSFWATGFHNRKDLY